MPRVELNTTPSYIKRSSAYWPWQLFMIVVLHHSNCYSLFWSWTIKRKIVKQFLAHKWSFFTLLALYLSLVILITHPSRSITGTPTEIHLHIENPLALICWHAAALGMMYFVYIRQIWTSLSFYFFQFYNQFDNNMVQRATCASLHLLTLVWMTPGGLPLEM